MFEVKTIMSKENKSSVGRKILFLLITLLSLQVYAQPFPIHQAPKREFRGAWIQAVNGQFKGMSSSEMKSNLLHQLNRLEKAGINAVIFQVRPAADALYKSDIEPWSRFLSGEQGVPMDRNFDPMAFMIDECHRRGMEFHAWINPYRVKTNLSTKLSPNHLYHTNPEWFVEYGNQLYFDPALPESRQQVCRVVDDILTRYDVDGIHMDDYFYPYPKPGVKFNDDESFRRYGYGYESRGDWRRDNVNKLIMRLYYEIKKKKPWVKFGVSPFGIYRNQSSYPLGSKTRGLQNYDDLYADVLLWAKKGWVDYLMPQIYWEVGHPVADYAILVDWWAKHNGGKPIIIGQSVVNTINNVDPEDTCINQLLTKMAKQRSYQTIVGSCQWPASAIVNNEGHYAEALESLYHDTKALMPRFDEQYDKRPNRPKKLKAYWMEDGYVLFWTAPKHKSILDEAVQYVVYRFPRKMKVDIDSPKYIVAITRNPFIKLPYVDGKTKYRYVVTALDRFGNESKMKTKKIKL